MTYFRIAWFLTLNAYCFPVSAAPEYDKMGHRVFVDALRAGNHDASGDNDYYFELVTRALRNTKADLDLPIEKRQQLSRDPVVFGEIKVKALTTWKPENGKPEESKFYAFDGEFIRALVSEAMRTFNVREDEVGVVTEVRMLEKNKKYWFFGQDTLVGQSRYYPIPFNNLQAPIRTNAKLSIMDDKGADVLLKVKYDFPANDTSEVKAPEDSEKKK